MAKKHLGIAEVVSQTELIEDIYSLWIANEEIARAARPGQFVSVYSDDERNLLPRPISICEINKEEGTLRLVYRIAGKGTLEFSKKQKGDALRVMGPLGNGWPEVEGKALLIGGGIGIPPVVELGKALKARGNEVITACGYRSELFLEEEIRANGEMIISTDDGSHGVKGTVIDAIKEAGVKADVILACGPTPMLRGVKAFAKEEGILCYVSMEERMACGIGACLGCVCNSAEVDDHSKVKNKRVCADGPVFLASEVEL